MKNIIIFFLFITLLGKVNAQFVSNRKSFSNKGLNFTSPDSQAKDITRYLPKGYVSDGSIDYTQYLQKALNENTEILMPNFPVKISGLKLSSNKVLYFNVNSSLVMKANNSSYYAIISIIGAKNVKIYNPKLIGYRTKGNTGEWGHGIEIVASSNIVVENAKINNCRGDGIYLSNVSVNNKKSYRAGVSNIVIRNAILDYNRRNGISILAGNGINLDNIVVTNTMGTNPQAGIMIEPSNSLAPLEDIVIENSNLNNNVIGIGFNLNNYAEGGVSKYVTITLRNVNLNNSYCGVHFSGFKSKPNKKRVIGAIKLENIKINGAKTNLVKTNDFGLFPKLQVKNFYIENKKLTEGSGLIDKKSQNGFIFQ